MILQFSVDNQRLTRNDDSFLVERSSNYLTCKFSFSEDWEGLTRIALFLPANETIPIPAIIDDSGECNIPKKITYYGGQCKIAVLGGTTDIINTVISGENLETEDFIITSNICRISFNSTIHVDEIGEDEDIENPFIEFLSRINKVSDDLDAHIRDTNNPHGLKSITHTWNGTVLTVESASGVSSADLKGYTPKKGVDYWNNEDIGQIHEYVDDQYQNIKTDVDGLRQQIENEAHFRGYLSTNAKIQTLEATPNDFAYSAESGTKWIYDVENGWTDTGSAVPDQLTPPSNATPLVDGVATPGQSEEYSRSDHRHPTDLTRVSVEDFNAFKSDLNTGLDNIIAIQNTLIGGGSV